MPTSNSLRRNKTSPRWRDTIHFSLNFFLILTPVNHLLEFYYSRYANYSLIMQNTKNLHFRNQWYRYHSVMYRYQTDSREWYRYHLDGTSTISPLHKGYRYHTCLVPVPSCDSAQKWQNSPFFIHLSSIILFYSILHKKPTWNPS